MNKKNSLKARLSLILIVVFTFALLLLIGLASWRNNATTNLEQAVNHLGQQNHAINLADESIDKFFNIENAFRMYSATGQEQYRTEYTTGLIVLRKMLDSLQRSSYTVDPDRASLQLLLKKKVDETNMFLHLKTLNDSLIQATVKLRNFAPLNTDVFKPLSPKDAKVFPEKTTVVPENKSDRKLFGRIRDAIRNKDPKQTSTLTTANTIGNEGSAEKNPTLNVLNDQLRSSIDKLAFNYQQLGENEKRLIISNNRLLTRLSNILKNLKHLQVEMQELRARELKKEAKTSINELSDISRLILFVSLILAAVILFNAWQLFRHEKRLVADGKEAVRQTRLRSDFLSHMSHEIRTPLNSILGFSEQLEKSSLNDVQKEQIAAVRRSSKILLSIVNDVLDLSKFETGNLNLHTSNFYPEKTIKHVVSSLQLLADKKEIMLSCHCEMSNELRIAGDEYRLKQVLINLINNAIKFTDSGTVDVNAKMSGNDLVVEVSDTGRGIAKDNIKSIFDQFTQVTHVHDHEKRNGSGLGLAISKKIILVQGGNIDVKSELGKGSVFTFQVPYLPFQPSLETDIKKSVKPALDVASLSSLKVLVAEDDKMNIMLISTIFNKWGLAFDVVESGRQAFDYFKRGTYDMVLTDIHMPDGDGISLTKLIRNFADTGKSSIPILAITANALEKDLEGYMAIGMNDHVVKPFSEEKLFETIRSNMKTRETASLQGV
ncbi:ATP-binding protein [Daejeonella sp.]|uniref:ATP-binding protein n=1 Tax=Daejeonella sp. TaxID=2805397 RepID=UPI0030C09798